MDGRVELHADRGDRVDPQTTERVDHLPVQPLVRLVNLVLPLRLALQTPRTAPRHARAVKWETDASPCGMAWPHLDLLPGQLKVVHQRDELLDHLGGVLLRKLLLFGRLPLPEVLEVGLQAKELVLRQPEPITSVRGPVQASPTPLRCIARLAATLTFRACTCSSFACARSSASLRARSRSAPSASTSPTKASASNDPSAIAFFAAAITADIPVLVSSEGPASGGASGPAGSTTSSTFWAACGKSRGQGKRGVLTVGTLGRHRAAIYGVGALHDARTWQGLLARIGSCKGPAGRGATRLQNVARERATNIGAPRRGSARPPHVTDVDILPLGGSLSAHRRAPDPTRQMHNYRCHRTRTSSVLLHTTVCCRKLLKTLSAAPLLAPDRMAPACTAASRG